VRLKIADDYVHALSLEAVAFFEHLVGFANAGRIAEKYFQFAPPPARLSGERA
jgi:hypothetical protein